MPIAPGKLDGVITNACNLPRTDICRDCCRIKQHTATHFLHTLGTLAGQTQLAHIKVLTVAVFPENRQGGRILTHKSDRRCPRSIRSYLLSLPARRALIAVPLPPEWLQSNPRTGKLIHKPTGYVSV